MDKNRLKLFLDSIPEFVPDFESLPENARQRAVHDFKHGHEKFLEYPPFILGQLGDFPNEDQMVEFLQNCLKELESQFYGHPFVANTYVANGNPKWVYWDLKETMFWLRWLILRLKEPLPYTAVPIEKNEVEPIESTRTIIENHLLEFVDNMPQSDYGRLVSALEMYFESDTFPDTAQKIIVTNVGVKRFCWVLGKIYKQLKNEKLKPDYLRFAKQSISLLAKTGFDETNIRKSNLYSYFTTQTKKTTKNTL